MECVISPLVGEMGGSPEGGAVERDNSDVVTADMAGDVGGTAPPSALPGISPTRGDQPIAGGAPSGATPTPNPPRRAEGDEVPRLDIVE